MEAIMTLNPRFSNLFNTPFSNTLLSQFYPMIASLQTLKPEEITTPNMRDHRWVYVVGLSPIDRGFPRNRHILLDKYYRMCSTFPSGHRA